MKFTIDLTPRKVFVAILVTALLVAGLASVITWLVLRGDGSHVATEAPVTVTTGREAPASDPEPAISSDGDLADPEAISGDRAAAESDDVATSSPPVASDGEQDPAPVEDEARADVEPAAVEPEEEPAEETETGPGAREEEPQALVEDEAEPEEPPGPVGDEAAETPSEPDEEAETTEAAPESDDVEQPPAAPAESVDETGEEAEAVAAPAETDESADPGDEATAAPAEVAEPAEQAAEPAPASTEPDVDTTAPVASAGSAREARSGGEDTLIAANGDTTCAVIPDGGISCWGADGLQHRLTAAGIHDVVAVSLSDRKYGNYPTTICVLHGDGTVSCWGDGYDGRLGQGDDNGAVLAKQVPGLEDVTAIAAGAGHVCVLHADGGVSCWGDGDWGQMGDGTDATRRSPYRVPGVGDVTAIAAGYARNCAVHSDGTVTCWGKWGSGGYSAVPAKVTGLEDVVSLAAGVYHLCAVHSDGRVSCSRDDPSGHDSTPSVVPGIDDAVAVSVGEGSFCVLHRTGGVSCWGRNHEGQVGDGTRGDTARPARLQDIDDAVAITVSGPNQREEVHACALREDGGAYCWGNNGYGQLGTGDREDRLVPTRVAVIDEGRMIVDPFPETPAEYLQSFTELVVAHVEDDFPWLRTTWESLRGKVHFTDTGTFGGWATHACYVSGGIYMCEPTGVRFSTRFGVNIGGIAHEFAHAYDANTAATPTRAWGAVQLYFNVTYKDCFPGIESIGAEFLADTMAHLIEPASWLTYYESSLGGQCPQQYPEPSALDEEVVLTGLAGEVPAWYTENITNGAELWAAFLSRPGDKLFANIMHEFGGLCSTNWVRHPLDPNLFPPEGTNPFADGGC